MFAGEVDSPSGLTRIFIIILRKNPRMVTCGTRMVTLPAEELGIISKKQLERDYLGNRAYILD